MIRVEVSFGGVGGDVGTIGGGVRGVRRHCWGRVRGRVDAVGGQWGSYTSSPSVHLI